MCRWMAAFVFFLLTACSGGGGGGVAYKYQLTGSYQEVASLLKMRAMNFILKWNESSDGTITGVFSNESTGESINVTGTSDNTGRTIQATRSSVIDGVKSFHFVIAQTGDLSGNVSATFTAYDESNNVVHTETITVEAETTGATPPAPTPGDEDDDEDGGDLPTNFQSYNGTYSGSMTEVSNSIATGSTPYCNFSFSSENMKFEYRHAYGRFGFSTRFTSGGGLYADITNEDASPLQEDPANMDVLFDGGFPSATLVAEGANFSGIKVMPADTSHRQTARFEGGFTGTNPRRLTGTLTGMIGGNVVCVFTVNMSKD